MAQKEAHIVLFFAKFHCCGLQTLAIAVCLITVSNHHSRARLFPKDRVHPTVHTFLSYFSHIYPMDLPSARELELEVLLRQRETQLTELRDEVISLRRYLAKQPGPSKTELVTLPPAVLAVLMPHIESQVNHPATSVSATVAGGVNQRMRQLQEENDELYNLLKLTETGKLKDEVRSLRRAVAKLEGALKESHQVISSLSEELEKTHEVLMSNSRHKDLAQPYPRAYTDSPLSSYRPDASSNNPSANSKPPPTGPRAHKRPRLVDSQPSPPARPMVPLPPKPQTQNHTHHSHSHHSHPPPIGPMRDQSRQASNIQDKDTARHNRPNINNTTAPNLHHNSKMELDGSSRPASPFTVRERERAREREKNNKERERRDRESRDISSNATTTTLPSKPAPANTAGRRNGNNHSNAAGRVGGGGGGPGSGRKPTNNNNSAGGSHTQWSDNRTLQERMGL